MRSRRLDAHEESHRLCARQLRNRLVASRKTIVLVDAPTSKVKIISDYVSFVAELALTQNLFGERWCVCVALGSRVDILGTVQGALVKQFPRRPIYTITCSTGRAQTARKQPTYLLYVLSKILEDLEDKPVVANINACHAKAIEGLRLRCLRRDCPHRPDSERKAEEEEATAASEELNPCDMEVAEGGDMMDITEEPDGEHDMEIAEALGQQQEGPEAKKYVVDLFTFAKPVGHYTLVLDQVCHASRAGNLVVLTRTAHPASLAAGRAFGLEVFGLCNGPSEHCMNHGKELLEKMFLANHWANARASTQGVDNKRIRATSQNFAVLAAPSPSLQVSSRGRLRIINIFNTSGRVSAATGMSLCQRPLAAMSWKGRSRRCLGRVGGMPQTYLLSVSRARRGISLGCVRHGRMIVSWVRQRVSRACHGCVTGV